MRRSVLTLLLLSFFTFFLGLGRQAITDSDEGFYAEAAREMVESGDWLTPHFNYEDRWQKPILYYWLTAALYRVTGPIEWSARFWSALSGLGLVLITWAAARRMSGRDDTAWLAGAIVATCAGYFAMARLALPDLPLACCITLGIWASLERRWVWAGVAAGLGFLLKGPVALAVPAVVLLPIWWREGALRPRWRELTIAAAIFAVVGLPWYVAMTLQHGTAYLESFFLSDNLERFATDRFNAPRPIWFYAPIVLGGLLSWAMFLLVLPWNAIREVARRQRRVSHEEWRLLIWAIAPLVLFTASIGKQPRYILPVLPPLAILIAGAIASRVRQSDARDPRGLTVATWLTAVLYVVLAVLVYRAGPLFITVAPPVTALAVGVIASAAAVLVWLAVTRRWIVLPVMMTIASVVLLLAVQFGAFAGRRPEPVEQMAALVRLHRTGGEPVGEYQVFVRNLVFYLGFKQVELFDEARALDFLKSSQRVLLVVRERDVPRLESISGINTKPLGEVVYLDTANIRLRTLLAPIPDQDLETVLLVTNR